MTPPTSVQTVTAELLPLTFEGIEDFLCEGNCKNPGMCNDTETTWCGRKAEAFVKSIATLTSSLTAAEARLGELSGRVTELLELVEGIPGTPDEMPDEPCEELCGNSWCNQFGCISAKIRDARAALSQTEEGV